MIIPFQQGEALLQDIRQASSRSDIFHLWWLGQSGFLVKWQEKFLLFDPYLSDSLTKKYALTHKPHVRMTELAIQPDHLNFIHLVTSSHNHTDHLDGETLKPLSQANPALKMVIPEANRAFVVERIGSDPAFPTGLNAGESVKIEDFTLTAVPAAHEQLEIDEQGRHRYLGYVAEFGEFAIYHSGDTILYEGMAEILRPFQVDLALLPINGRDPKRGVAGNLNAEEAAWLGKTIGAKLVVPCHYDMFTFNTADPADFAAAAKRQGQSFQILQCGERLTFSKPE